MENRVRDQIVSAAFDVLLEVGPTRLRIQEVAKRAEVSPTLLYYYFDGKHALIAAAYAQDYAKILIKDLAIVEAAFHKAENPIDLLRYMTSSYQEAFADVETRRRRLDALAAAQHDPAVAAAIAPKQRQFIAAVRDVLTGCVSRGWLPEETNIDAFIMSMMALPLGLVFQDLDPEFSVDMESYLMMIASGSAASGATLTAR
jgi:AcrR family transcriptional regulator